MTRVLLSFGLSGSLCTLPLIDGRARALVEPGRRVARADREDLQPGRPRAHDRLLIRTVQPLAKVGEPSTCPLKLGPS